MSRTVTLRSVKPKLTVTATTPGAEIFINEVSRGTNSWSGELLADSYVVEGRLAGHRSNSQTIALADNESRTVTIPALTPIMGTLSIDYEPVDATVTIDDRAAGTTPLLLDNLLVGTHRVTISAPGYTPATLTATVSESAPATLSGALTPKPTGPIPDDIALTKEYERFQDSSTGKYGYKHNGRVVIPAKYDRAYGFDEGLAMVELNGKWNYIDKTGKFIASTMYDDIWSFKDLGPVKINGKWGFIDKAGKMVIPAKYDDVPTQGEFTNGKVKVELNGREFYIDRNGNEVK